MSLRKRLDFIIVAAVLGVIVAPVLADSSDYWVQAMKDVHFASTNTKGAVARFGDSITYSAAFYLPLRATFTTSVQKEVDAQKWLHSYMNPTSWTWQYDNVAQSDGNWSGTRSDWPLAMNDQFSGKRNIDGWLAKLKPEMAVIMWGTNDLAASTSVAQYTSNMRSVVQACIDHGTIPLLTTIPPRVGFASTYPGYAQAMRDLAVQMKVPLIDYNQEVLTRQPTNWANTLISGDGVHPSSYGGSSFSASALATDGYLLRNYATLMEMYDVYNAAINVDPVQIKYTATDLGGGKKGYSFYVNGLAGTSNMYIANLTFTGNIQQQRTSDDTDVDKEDDANMYAAMPDSGYDKAQDSYFLSPFTYASSITHTANTYSIFAGSGSAVQNANLAYIATDGQLELTGTIQFNSKTYNIDLLLGPHSGDANNDGAVNVVDLGVLAKNYDGVGKAWQQADYNGDGLVNVIDLGVLAKNYDWSGTPWSDGAVPEPATLGLLAAPFVLWLRKRK